MRCRLPLVGLVSLLGVAHAEDPGFGVPMVALTSTRGVDLDAHRVQPWVTIYPDGHFIARDRGSTYVVGKLTRAELKALLADLPLGRIGSLHPVSPQGDDGATECVLVWTSGQERHDCYWGNLASPEADIEPAPPAELVDIWTRLESVKSRPLGPWRSTNLDVDIFPSRSGGHAMPWPATWPLPTATTDGLAQVTLPASQWPNVHDLVVQASGGRPVLTVLGHNVEINVHAAQPSLRRTR